MQIYANGLRLEVDDRGPRDGPPLLLIMGLGMQLIAWPEEFVERLVARGFRVIRFDNRDIGLSQGFDDSGVPRLALNALRYRLGLRVRSAYSLRDMAQDALGVMDALGLGRAHVCGISMGGMIAQRLAAGAPSRVISLTLMMTSTGARHLPRPDARVLRAMMAKPGGTGREAAVRWIERLFREIGSPAYPMETGEIASRARASVERSWHPSGSARQLAAILADGDRSPLLSKITAPTLVVHGLADPLVPAACGQDLAARIRGAETDFIAGMGHDLPPALLARLANGVARNAARAGQRGAAGSAAPTLLRPDRQAVDDCEHRQQQQAGG